MRFLVALAVLMFAIPAFAQNVPQLQKMDDGGIFRNFVWGATPEDVKKYESARYYKTEGESVYFLEAFPVRGAYETSFRRLIRYDFKNRKLWRASYAYQELDDPEPQKILDRHEDVKHELSETYGKPAREDMFWKDKTYYRFPQFWGRALFSGDLRFETEWNLPDTRILLELSYQKPFYELAYTAEQVTPETKDKTGTILDMPEPEKAPAVPAEND